MTKHGLKDATSDLVQVQAWWYEEREEYAGYSQANIGLATGKPSGIYVIDLDGPQGESTWAWLADVNNEPPCLSARTGGGRHLYYLLGQQDLGNTAKKIGPGIDTRGTGGYVLAPPSLHVSGKQYEWEAGELRPLPFWLYGILTAREEYTGPRYTPYRAQENDPAAVDALHEEALIVSRTQPGGRNQALYKAAFKMGTLVGGGDLYASLVGEALVLAGMAAGLQQIEAEKTVQSGIVSGNQHPRIIRTRQHG